MDSPHHHVHSSYTYTDMDIEVTIGGFTTDEEKARVKRLHDQLKKIADSYAMITPLPEFKIVMDRYSQVKVKMDERMLKYILARFSEIEDPTLTTESPNDEPPEWFMKLMGNEPYEHLLPPEMKRN